MGGAGCGSGGGVWGNGFTSLRRVVFSFVTVSRASLFLYVRVLFPVSFCLFSFPVSTYGFYNASSFLLLMLTCHPTARAHPWQSTHDEATDNVHTSIKQLDLVT